MTDLVIHNALVITGGECPTVIEKGGVAINDGKIMLVGRDDEIAPFLVNAAQIIDARGDILMPGLINTHCHVADTLFRGLVENLTLEPWLQTVWKAEAAILNPQTTYLGSALGFAEMALSGVTTTMDMFWHPFETVQAARDVGVRVSTGGIIFDYPGVTGDSVERRFEIAEEFLQKFVDDADVIPAVLPHGAYTVSPENMVRAKALADKYGALFCTHAAETPVEVADIQSRYNNRVVKHLDKLGVLDCNTVLAHCVHLDTEEIEILARTGAGMSHNPVSNLKLASGVARVPEMLDAGVLVSLGTDGAISGNDLDLWLAMRLAAMLHKGVSGNPEVVSTYQALDMATHAGARTLGVGDKLGTLEAGKLADMVILDIKRAHAVPMFDAVTHVVFSANKSDVKHVFVGGAQIVEDGKLTKIVLEDILQQVRALTPAIAASIA